MGVLGDTNNKNKNNIKYNTVESRDEKENYDKLIKFHVQANNKLHFRKI